MKAERNVTECRKRRRSTLHYRAGRPTGAVENVACGGENDKTGIPGQGPATCSILTGLWILGGLYLGK